jgi:pilus assembly protein CpaB
MSRRRAAAMLGASAVCAGLAVSAVDRYTAGVESQIGSPVPVLVAARDIPAGHVLTAGDAAGSLAERLVPARFAPPAALRSRAEAIGRQAVAGLTAGDYVGARQLQEPRRPRERPQWSGDARLVEVAVAGARSFAQALRPGALVDVLITTDRGRTPRTFLALQRVSLVGFDSGSGDALGEDARPADGRVTLRATLRQAALLTAADNFAREVRVVPRAAGDHRRLGPVSIPAAGLDR